MVDYPVITPSKWMRPCEDIDLARSSVVFSVFQRGLKAVRRTRLGIVIAESWVVSVFFQSKIQRFVFFSILLFPLLVSEVNNDIAFAQSRTAFYSFKIFGLLNLYDLIFFIFFGAWLLRKVVSGTFELNVRFDFPLFLFVMSAAVSLVYGLALSPAAYRLVFFEFINITRFVLVYFMARDFLCTARDLTALFRLLFLTSGIVGLIGLSRFLGGAGIDLYNDGHRIMFYDISLNTGMGLGFIALVCVVTKRFSWKRSICYLAAFAPVLLSVLVSYRRTLWVGMAICLFLLWLQGSARVRTLLAKKVALSFLFLTGLIVLIHFSLKDMRVALAYGGSRVLSLQSLSIDSSNRFRVVDVQNSLHSIVQHPIFGVGLGGRYDVVYGGKDWHAYRVAKLSNVSHNSYLFLWMKMGIVAFSSFLWMAFQSLRLIFVNRRALFSSEGSGDFGVAAVFVFYFFLTFVFGPGFLYGGIAGLFGCSLAMIGNFREGPAGSLTSDGA